MIHYQLNPSPLTQYPIFYTRQNILFSWDTENLYMMRKHDMFYWYDMFYWDSVVNGRGTNHACTKMNRALIILFLGPPCFLKYSTHCLTAKADSYLSTVRPFIFLMHLLVVMEIRKCIFFCFFWFLHKHCKLWIMLSRPYNKSHMHCFIHIR